MMKQGPDSPDYENVKRTIQDALGVDIEAASNEELESPRELARFVQEHLSCSLKEQTPCLTAQAFYQMRRTIAELNPQLAAKLRPDANLESLIPKEDRPALWQQLNELGYALPDLHYAPVPALGLYLGTFILMLALGFVTAVFWPAWPVTFLFLMSMATAAVLGRDSILKKCPLAIPHPFKTIRGMATYLAYRECDPSWINRLSKRQVREVVLLAFALECSMPIEKLRR